MNKTEKIILNSILWILSMATYIIIMTKVHVLTDLYQLGNLLTVARVEVGADVMLYIVLSISMVSTTTSFVCNFFKYFENSKFSLIIISLTSLTLSFILLLVVGLKWCSTSYVGVSPYIEEEVTAAMALSSFNALVSFISYMVLIPVVIANIISIIIVFNNIGLYDTETKIIEKETETDAEMEIKKQIEEVKAELRCQKLVDELNELKNQLKK